MKKPNLNTPQAQIDRLKQDLISYLKENVQDHRFLEHSHFKNLSVVELVDSLNQPVYWISPERIHGFCKGILYFSTDKQKSYYKAMVDFAWACNAELDLIESKWTERRIAYITANKPPPWYKELFSEKMKNRMDKFSKEEIEEIDDV